MFYTSASPRSINVYCHQREIDAMKANGFAVARSGILVYAAVGIGGDIVLYREPRQGAVKYAFSAQSPSGLYRLNIGTPDKHNLTMEQIGGAWQKQAVDFQSCPDAWNTGVLRLKAPSGRLPLDYVPTPKPRSKTKKVEGNTVLAELPDGSTLEFAGLPIAEILHLQQHLASRGYVGEVAEGVRIVRDAE